jgi:crossover junction endodeoxyribonuclease RusA
MATIFLSMPPSTNSIWRSVNGRNIVSARYREWKKTAGLELMAQRPVRHLGPVAVTIMLVPPDKRRFDLDNRVKPVLDLLVSGGIIEGDDSRIVKRIVVEPGEGKPGAYVECHSSPSRH